VRIKTSISVLALLLVFVQICWTQERLEEIIVTATRTEEPTRNIPASVTVISEKEINLSSVMDVDDILRMYPGIDVSRPTGFLGRGRVSLRGVGNQPGRTLVLLDGCPMNKADTGSVNWNRISLNDVQRVEIVRGPTSALYGSSAMGGVINIVTKKPTETLSTNLKLRCGSLKTFGGDLLIRGKAGKLGAKLSTTYLQSDGYDPEPPEKRDKYNIKRDLKQGILTAGLSYDITERSSLSVGYSRFDDHRGEGKKYRHEKGVYREWDTDAFDLSFKSKTGIGGSPLNLKANLYYNVEHYYWNRERLRKGKYTWYEVNVPRVDGGAMIQASLTSDLMGGKAKGTLTVGIDGRYGSVEGEDAYRIKNDKPSNLKVTNRGKQQNISLFAQGYVGISRVNLLLGARYDFIRSYDGEFKDPSGFLPSKSYDEKRWSGFSPRIGLVYHLRDDTRLRLSLGGAFRAPILDDLYRNGIFWGRIYKANPELEPERIFSAEIGAEHEIGDLLQAELSAYYSVGGDYFYPIKVGKDPNTGRDLYQRQNVGKVEIYGLEPGLTVRPAEGLKCFANLTLNSSKIKEFKPNPELEGKYLEYTPRLKANVGLLYSNPSILTASLVWRYVGGMYVDPENTEKRKIDPYYVIDLKLSRQIARYGDISVDIKNLLDREYVEREDYLDPGRFIVFSVNLKY